MAIHAWGNRDIDATQQRELRESFFRVICSAHRVEIGFCEGMLTKSRLVGHLLIELVQEIFCYHAWELSRSVAIGILGPSDFNHVKFKRLRLTEGECRLTFQSSNDSTSEASCRPEIQGFTIVRPRGTKVPGIIKVRLQMIKVM
jgi:hypothetical protein